MFSGKYPYSKKNYMKERELYETAANNFVKRYGYEVSPHIIDVIISVMRTKDNTQQGGSFVQAVCANDLCGAIRAADTDCLNNLRIITLASQFCNLQNKGL